MFLWSFSCPANHVPDWQPRVSLGTVEARSVDVKNAQKHASPGEERGNETGKVVIVHGSVKPVKRHQLLA